MENSRHEFIMVDGSEQDAQFRNEARFPEFLYVNSCLFDSVEKEGGRPNLKNAGCPKLISLEENLSSFNTLKCSQVRNFL